MTSAEKYAMAAYFVVLGVVLVWVFLYAFKLARLEREVTEFPIGTSNESGNHEDRARAAS